MAINQKELDNILRWDGQARGWYEVYYLKFNDPKSNSAYWLRYTMTSPLSSAPYCELWGIFFDVKDPRNNFAVKERFTIEKLTWEKERFEVGIAGAKLGMNTARGAINDKARGLALSWDLEFDSPAPTFHHFPYSRMYGPGFPKTKVLSPHMDARFSGTVTANGRQIKMQEAPGQQTHIWGTKHALRWAWGHCNSFEEKGAVWEGLDTQIKLGPIESPHLKLFYLRTGGREYFFNSVRLLFTNKSEWGLGQWNFEAKNNEVRVVGEISCRPQEMVCVTYTDPDGENLWCNNSKVASIGIEIFGPDGKRIGKLTSKNACAAEFVDRRTYEGVDVSI